jgi:putative MFS transporter
MPTNQPAAANARTLTIEDAIEQIGVGRFQHRLLVICGTGWAADAMEVLIISFVIPAVIAEWGLTNAQAGLLGTAIFVGMLVGAWFWGTISDYVGRILGFQLTVLIDSVFGFLSALAPSFPVLVILRSITGFGVGGTLPVDYSIFSEYLPARNRGRWLVLLESFWAIGTIVTVGLAWLIVPSTLGWRGLLAVSAVPGLIVFFVRRYIPESPRYLLLQGQEDKALAVLRHVAKVNGVAFDVDKLYVPQRNVQAKPVALWKPAFARTTAMLWIAWFAISLGYYGTLIWLPKILGERGFDMLPVFQSVFISALAQLPGYFSAAWLVEKWGRKVTLGIYLAFSGIFTYVFAVVTNTTSIVATISAATFFTLGAWGVLYAYTPELYPTEIRATGMGAASGMTRIAGAIAPTLGGILLASGNLLSALTLYAAAFIVGGIAVFVLGKETKDIPLMETIG